MEDRNQYLGSDTNLNFTSLNLFSLSYKLGSYQYLLRGCKDQ